MRCLTLPSRSSPKAGPNFGRE